MYKDDLFKDKVVLVTGGRSGIGYGIAEHFLQLGAKLFICSRKEAPLAEAAKQLNEIGPCAFMACDIRESAAVEKMADQIQETYGRLDILVNNAGGQFPSLANYISDNGWDAVIRTNLNGTFYVSRIMANRFMIPQESGNIINIVVNGLRGFPGMAHTGAARAGVENLTKSLAQEWARYNIRVNSVAPGTIISSGLDTYAPPVKALLDTMKEENLMKRHGTIADVSNAVCFYASPLSAYTSGTTFYVDGMDHLHGNRMTMVDMFRE
ncbi:MAG: SDR family oxidoreductase [Bacteroidota bacterium]